MDAKEFYEESEEVPAPNVATLEHLLAMDKPERKTLLWPWLKERNLAMLHSWRGVGKSQVAFHIAVAVASGSPLWGWKAPEPRGVLYIDGELSLEDVCNRGYTAIKSLGADPKGNLIIVTPELQKHGFVPNLVDPQSQHSYDNMIETVDLVIVDNLSTLTSGLNENEADKWHMVQRWLLSLRARGKAVLLVHHSGKGGAQRGTSKREDILDTVINLSRTNGKSEEDGCNFLLKFEKCRAMKGGTVSSFEASLLYDANDLPFWEVKTLDESNYDRIVAMANEGMKQSEILKDLKEAGVSITRQAISKAVKKAKARGDLYDEE